MYLLILFILSMFPAICAGHALCLTVSAASSRLASPYAWSPLFSLSCVSRACVVAPACGGRRLSLGPRIMALARSCVYLPHACSPSSPPYLASSLRSCRCLRANSKINVKNAIGIRKTAALFLPRMAA